ncbi:MAG: ABC transporter ATP-binding protein [Candidatus Hodarchaeales archaeon]
MSYQYTLKTEDIHRTYYMGEADIEALKGISVEIKHGEYVSLMGPSGSGKTTFFNCVGGLDQPTKGRVYIDEVDIAKLDAYELAWLRCRKIGYIFQTFNLIPNLTAFENVEMPAIFAKVPRETRKKKVEEVLSLVGLKDRMGHRPMQLSGGQQQRVAIARSLVNDPAIILADEPTGNLDLETGLEIIQLLRNLNTEKGTTVLTATHDLKMIDVSDRIIWIEDGRVKRIETIHNVKVMLVEESGDYCEDPDDEGGN